MWQIDLHARGWLGRILERAGLQMRISSDLVHTMLFRNRRLLVACGFVPDDLLLQLSPVASGGR